MSKATRSSTSPLATTVENEGLRRWLAFKGGSGFAQTAAAGHHERKSSFVAHVTSYRSRLQAIYTSDLPLEAKRLAKSEVMADIKRSYLNMQEAHGGPAVYKDWLERDLNNAKIASLALYTQLLPAFEALLKEDDYDLPRFYRRMAALARLPPAERNSALKQVRLHPAAVSAWW